MLPYTRDVYFALFETYNAAIWPAQIAAIALAVLAVLLVLRTRPYGGRVAAAVIAAAWGWTGIAFHWLTFSTVNYLAPAFAVLFVVAALLFAWTGMIRGKLDLRFERSVRGWSGLGLVAAGLFGYVLFGWLAGSEWPQMAFFGVAPGPTVVFTLGILALAHPRVPWHLAVIPLVWALTGALIGWTLDILQDVVLLGGGVVLFVLALARRRN